MGCGASAKSTYEAPNGEASQPSTAAKPSSSEELSVGTRVEVKGLTGAVELNGKFGVIAGLNESTGRFVVNIVDVGEKSLKSDNLYPVSSAASAKPAPKPEKKADEQPSKKEKAPPDKKEEKAPPAKATPLKKEEKRDSKASKTRGVDPSKCGDYTVGDRVRAGGLNGSIELNGRLAVVFGFDKDSGRYIVEFEDGQGQKRLKGENLTAMGTATGPLAAKARMLAGI